MTAPYFTGSTILSEEAMDRVKEAHYFIESHRSQGHVIFERKLFGDDRTVVFVARTPEGVEIARHEWKKP